MDHRIWATNFISTTLSREPMVAAWNEVPAAGASPECAALVASAELVRWSAPELAAQFARRALTMAGSDALGAADLEGAIQARARALLTGALVRLGRPADAVEPGIVGLRAAEAAGAVELATAIRLDLAACSRGVGEPLIGCAVLAPVLEVRTGRPAERAVAIAQLVGCAGHVGRRDDLEDALAEADRLLAADDGLSADARRIERALLCVRTAAYHRRYGDTEDAVEAARDGLGLLGRLRDARLEGGQARARLTLELVCALLDDGELAEAEQAAAPVLAQPARATAAPAVGRLMLAMATRVHLPAGRVAPGRRLLADAVQMAERYGLDWLLADALTTIAHLDEQAAQPSDALAALRAAHAAEHRQLRAVGLAKRMIMTEFGMDEGRPEAVNALLRNVTGPRTTGQLPVPQPDQAATEPVVAEPPAAPTETDAATGLLNRDALFRRLEAVRGGDRPVALTLVRLDAVNGDARDTTTDTGGTAAAGDSAETTDDQLAELAGRVRDLAPHDAELARSDGSEVAVLLPHTTRDEAEEFAATIRAETRGREVSISTGVAQSDLSASTDEDADALLAAARSTLTPAEPERSDADLGVDVDGDTVSYDWPVDNDLPYGRAVLSTLSNGWAHPTDTETPLWQTVPPVPEPDEVPKPPPRPDIPEPPEPEPIPPTRPEPGPIPPGEPPPEPPQPSPLPQPEDVDEVDAPAPILGPVQGPVLRPDDLPARPDHTSGRRERADSATLADLLAGALAAYQSTTPEQPQQSEPARPTDTPPHYRTASGVGRHRSPDWASIDPDVG